MKRVMKYSSPDTTRVKPITKACKPAFQIFGIKINLQREWKMIPASMTRMLSTSVERKMLFLSDGESAADALALARTMRCPMYSTRKDRNMPAITIAAVVAS